MRPHVGCDGFIVDRDSMYTAHLVLLYLAKKLPGTIVPGDSEISRVQLLSFTRTCATVERDADDSNHSTFLYVESSKAVSGTQLRAPDYRQTGAILGLFLGASRYISYRWMDYAWVPGHKMPGNERAGMLAKAAAHNPPLGLRLPTRSHLSTNSKSNSARKMTQDLDADDTDRTTCTGRSYSTDTVAPRVFQKHAEGTDRTTHTTSDWSRLLGRVLPSFCTV